MNKGKIFVLRKFSAKPSKGFSFCLFCIRGLKIRIFPKKVGFYSIWKRTPKNPPGEIWVTLTRRNIFKKIRESRKSGLSVYGEKKHFLARRLQSTSFCNNLYISQLSGSRTYGFSYRSPTRFVKKRWSSVFWKQLFCVGCMAGVQLTRVSGLLLWFWSDGLIFRSLPRRGKFGGKVKTVFNYNLFKNIPTADWFNETLNRSII